MQDQPLCTARTAPKDPSSHWFAIVVLYVPGSFMVGLLKTTGIRGKPKSPLTQQMQADLSSSEFNEVQLGSEELVLGKLFFQWPLASIWWYVLNLSSGSSIDQNSPL